MRLGYAVGDRPENASGAQLARECGTPVCRWSTRPPPFDAAGDFAAAAREHRLTT